MFAKLDRLTPKCHPFHAALPLFGVGAAFTSLTLLMLTFSAMMVA